MANRKFSDYVQLHLSHRELEKLLTAFDAYLIEGQDNFGVIPAKSDERLREYLQHSRYTAKLLKSKEVERIRRNGSYVCLEDSL